VVPRIFGIPALRATVVAVIRRGPTKWMHVGRWDTSAPSYEPGAWLHGTIYPQRCDLSPDGRWLAYFALKPSARWDVGTTYIAISELPWLTAIAAWATTGTWTRGARFVEDRSVWDVGEPDHGDVAMIRQRFGLRLARADAFAVERRRGWFESADTPPRSTDDAWDEHRGDRIEMEKARPGGDGSSLTVRGVYAGRRELHDLDANIRYELREAGERRILDGVQWADWDDQGRLLVATDDGRLQIRGPGGTSVEWEIDEAAFVPDPAPAPEA
jgi:hypothetical protein